MFKATRRWWDTTHAIRRWLQTAPLPEKHVAHALWILNRHARSNRLSLDLHDEVYNLKSMIIQHWWEDLRFQSVAWKETQERECWSCDGTGEYWDGSSCWKCEGTGVYATVDLYCFRFIIGHRTYHWCQPAALCNYVVELQELDEPRLYHSPASVSEPIAIGILFHCLETLRVYAQMQGWSELPYKAQLPNTLHHALLDDLPVWIWDIPVYRQRIKHTLQNWKRRLLRQPSPWDDIPF